MTPPPVAGQSKEEHQFYNIIGADTFEPPPMATFLVPTDSPYLHRALSIWFMFYLHILIIMYLNATMSVLSN